MELWARRTDSEWLMLCMAFKDNKIREGVRTFGFNYYQRSLLGLAVCLDETKIL